MNWSLGRDNNLWHAPPLVVSDEGSLRITKMLNRPKDWLKVINAEAETCHWVAPDGTQHPCTDDENAEVRRELLTMRTISDKRRQQQIEER